MNPVVEVVGMMAAFVVWGGLATLFLLPYVKRQLADFPLHAKRTPFRALRQLVRPPHGGARQQRADHPSRLQADFSSEGLCQACRSQVGMYT